MAMVCIVYMPDAPTKSKHRTVLKRERGKKWKKIKLKRNAHRFIAMKYFVSRAIDWIQTDNTHINKLQKYKIQNEYVVNASFMNAKRAWLKRGKLNETWETNERFRAYNEEKNT